ncbi:DUF433 domain-containing protein [Neolewinella sp.]|uniref:DUF433 domain-containing protein n=1 Tax=Neolewinella sp. TaxID=2993543 RepID=UPI003B52CD65
MIMTIHDVVSVSAEVQSGTPVFRGTRVPVKNLFDYLRGGESVEEFVHDFPSVSIDQVRTLLHLSEAIATMNVPVDA